MTSQQIASQNDKPSTGIYGQGYGEYTAYLNGEEIGTVYGNGYADAYREFLRLVKEQRTASSGQDCPEGEE